MSSSTSRVAAMMADLEHPADQEPSSTDVAHRWR
jgi:hypothetical protein